ncbi:hypothetical protein KM1_059250 [Entamoeba histolytica HM-3:IMSS]|uniref:Uncharacterized protein n=1 Tax=Entamoeba histolytica HM-3:IMSS TaxID=885315 RepID=M7WPM6_ENTHI|nr:hypothetical protein KM1_059250 [Entamoeba histolytica HM-3:IMSS]
MDPIIYVTGDPEDIPFLLICIVESRNINSGLVKYLTVLWQSFKKPSPLKDLFASYHSTLVKISLKICLVKYPATLWSKCDKSVDNPDNLFLEKRAVLNKVFSLNMM